MSELRCLIIDFRKIFADFCLKKEKRGDFSLAVQIIFVTLQRDSIFDDNEYTGNDTADSRVLQDATRLESSLYTFQFSI